MNQLAALKDIIALAEKHGMEEEAKFTSLRLGHLREMVVRIETGVQDSAMDRWLRWAQLAVVASGVATLVETEAIVAKYEAGMSVEGLEACTDETLSVAHTTYEVEHLMQPSGVSRGQVQVALREYENHVWDAISRLCKCGGFFEATMKGHEMHDEHRLRATLNAANGVTER